MRYRRALAKDLSHKHSRLYGRRQGRPLNKARQGALDALMPEIGIPENLVNENGALTPEKLFGKIPPALWFEIGFGHGEHLAELMKRHPGHGFIGAEPYINGMAFFLKDIQDKPHDNIRVWMDDAVLIADSLIDRCLDGIYVLNPDPWPKTRHHKRRIISQENLDKFARILKPGGKLVMTTDVSGLADWMVTQACRHPAFEWTAEKADDWRKPPKDWIPTKYENKGAKGSSKMCYLIFDKLK